MKKILLATALLASAGFASAQGYVGALAGLSKVNQEGCFIAACDDSDTGYKVYGGYEVLPHLSIELGYTDFGKFNSGTTAEIKATALSVSAAYRVPFTRELEGVGRLGLASVKTKWFGGSGTEAKLYAGIGLDYALSKDFKLNAAIDLTQAEAANGNSGGIYLFGVGAQVGF